MLLDVAHVLPRLVAAEGSLDSQHSAHGAHKQLALAPASHVRLDERGSPLAAHVAHNGAGQHAARCCLQPHGCCNSLAKVLARQVPARVALDCARCAVQNLCAPLVQHRHLASAQKHLSARSGLSARDARRLA